LRQNLSKYLRRVERGERLLVTDRNRPVAEGRVAGPRRRGLPAPLEMTGDPNALSRALDEIRGDERQAAAARLASLRTFAPGI
jgi:antitoxin (DNA-binding transcriptional repressor) of toxin-antitoxin stability system